jgi:sugar phosphate isomerase/epimerase
MGEKDGHMADVGSGAIDWKRLFAQSQKAGIKHYFVEHDEPASPLDSLRNSYKYLHDLRY